MYQALEKTLGIIFAFTLGILFPYFHIYDDYARWLIVAMLTITLLRLDMGEVKLYREHFYIIGLSITLGLGLWALCTLFGFEDSGLMAFFISMTPTATSTPTIVGYMRGSREFALTSVVLSSIAIMVLMPVLLPFILGHSTPGLSLQIAKSLLIILGLPVCIAFSIKKIYPKIRRWDYPLDRVQWFLWIAVLIIISAGGSHFIRNHPEYNGWVLLRLGLISMTLCFVNFALGYKFGGSRFSLETGQCMGQKNTALALFLAMTYTSPLIVLSLTFYVVFHNFWSAFQIFRLARQRKQEKILDAADYPVV